MRAVIYTRVGNPRSDDSHVLQETRCRLLAAERGCEVVDRYTDTGMSRGDFLRMLDDLRDLQFEVVLTDRLGRLPRGIEALERLVLAGGRLLTEDGVDSGVTKRQVHDEQVRELASGMLPLS